MYVSTQNKKWFMDIAKVKKNKVSGHFAICCLIQRATQTNFDLCLLSLSLFFQKFIAFASLSLTTLTHTLTLFTFACSTKLTLYTCFPHRSAPPPPSNPDLWAKTWFKWSSVQSKLMYKMLEGIKKTKTSIFFQSKLLSGNVLTSYKYGLTRARRKL